MKLENQVVSLELAKKLKELGVNQESLFWWKDAFYDKDGRFIDEHEWHIANRHDITDTSVVGACSAFTVAELGYILGMTTSDRLQRAYGHVFNVPGTRFISPTGLHACLTRPDLCAKMLIYLIENKLITV